MTRLIGCFCNLFPSAHLSAHHYRSFEVVGYDINESFIETALQSEKKQPLGISYHIYDAGAKIDSILYGAL